MVIPGVLILELLGSGVVTAQILGSVLIALVVAWIGFRAWRRCVVFRRSRRWSRLRRALSDQERRVLEFRYGLYDGQPRTLDEVALAFETTRERIREIENQSLKKFQALSGESPLDADAPVALPAPPPPPTPRQWGLEGRLSDFLGRTLGPIDFPDEPEAEGGLGVREPRRPRPSGLSGAAALPLPDFDLDS